LPTRLSGAPAGRDEPDVEAAEETRRGQPEVAPGAVAEGAPDGEREGVARLLEDRDTEEAIVVARRVEDPVHPGGVAMDRRRPGAREDVVVSPGDPLVDPRSCRPSSAR
jgi:hypothetical protein